MHYSELLFGGLIIGFVIVAMFRIEKFYEWSVLALLILFPLSPATFMPRSTFGIAGLNPINIFWAIALLMSIASAVRGRAKAGWHQYLSLPAILFIFLYFVAYLRTVTSIASLTTYPEFQLTRVGLTLGSLLKPMEIWSVGWIVLVLCQIKKNTQLVEYGMQLAVLALAAVTTLVYLTHAVGEGYTAGRDALSGTMGLHANSLGALGVYYLVFAVTSRSGRQLSRWFAIGAALVVVVLSFSRMSYLATLVLMVMFYRRLPVLERRMAIVFAVLVVAIFSAQVISRVEWGITSANQQKGETVSAGRVDGIWKPLLPQVELRPVFGSGLFGMLKSQASRDGLHLNTPHSGYLQVLLDMGLIGLITLLWLLCLLYTRARRMPGPAAPLLVMMMALSLTGHSFYPYPANTPVFVGLGLLAYQRFRRNQGFNSRSGRRSPPPLFSQP